MTGPNGIAGLRSRYRPPAGSDRLVVVFSQVRVPDGKFGLERLFAGTRHALLLVNQPDNRWYRGADAGIDAALAEAAARAKPRQIIFYGSSMGAFGALAAAARHPHARVVAFAPDYRIGEPASQSAAAGLTAEDGEPDLGARLAARGAAAGPVDVVVGLFDPYDASVGVRLAALKLPGVRVIPLASSHELHDHLYSVNVIRKAIMTFDRDLAQEAAARGLQRPVADWRPYAAFARLDAAFRAGERVAVADVEALGLLGNPGVEILKSEVAEASGDMSTAIDVLERLEAAVMADPALASLTKRYLKTMPRRRIRLLAAAGRVDEARAVAAEASRRYPGDEEFVGSSV